MNNVDFPGGNVGKRAIPWVVDAYAKNEPQKVYARVPGHDLSQGFRDITYGEIAHAINHVAGWLKGLVTTNEPFPVISYLGSNDVRYTIVVLAAIKIGFVWFFCSAEYAARIQRFKKSFKPDLKVHTLPSLDEILATPNTPYPYERSWDEVRRDPILICHTSGSTSTPKPIWLRNQYFAAIDVQSTLPSIDGRRVFCYSTFTSPFVSAFPPFHVGGMKGLLASSIMRGVVLVLPPPEKPPNGELLNQILKMTRPKSLNTPPTILEQLIEEPGGFEQLAQLDWVSSGGGQLSPSVGDKVAKVTTLAQFIGSTELGIVPVLQPDPPTWNYFHWHPAFKTIFEHVSEDMYQLVIERNTVTADIQCLQWEDIEGNLFHTSDMFTPHPSNRNLWQFRGRTDDVIVLGNGEKFNPIAMERIVQEDPLVSGAVIVGQGRFQACLIIEPKEHIKDNTAFIDQIWASIEAANTEGPAHAQIFASHVIVASREKPLVRVGKGSIARRATEQEYECEVDALYAANDNDGNGPRLESDTDAGAIKLFVRACAAPFLDKTLVGDDEDLFANGMDSLQTSQIVRRLKRGLKARVGTENISTKTIYANPRIDLLVQYVQRLLDLGQNNESNGTLDRESRMQAMVEKYTRDLPVKPKSNGVQRNGDVEQDNSLCVMLTGSTGTLGTHLVRVLTQDPKLRKIYCLNRAADARERYESAIQDQGLQGAFDSLRVKFIQAKFGDARFGLSEQRFNQLLAEVDIIIHNAWAVNFNHSLESFEKEHIRSTRNLVDWSLSSKRHPHIFFISSLASIGNWAVVHPESADFVPERQLDDYRLSQTFGYGESKHVAERILDEARSRSDVPATIFRVGQLASPTRLDTGEWNRHEYLPALVQTSVEIGCIPESWNDIDWVPVDLMARIMVELMHTEHGSQHRGLVNNLVNPNHCPWSLFVEAVQNHYSELHIKVAPLAEWIGILRKVDPTNASELNTKPAVKILDFYETNACGAGQSTLGAQVETRNAVVGSETMATLTAVRSDWIEVWLKTWDFKPQY